MVLVVVGGPGTSPPQILRDDCGRVFEESEVMSFLFLVCVEGWRLLTPMLFKTQLYMYLWYDTHLVCVSHMHAYLIYVLPFFWHCIMYLSQLYLYLLHGSLANGIDTTGLRFLFSLPS